MIKPALNLQKFKTQCPQWRSDFNIHKRDDSIYQRISCQYREKATDFNAYYACINTKTGDIYTDCRKRKIFVKTLSLIFVRPIHTLIKTLWHISIIAPIAYNIFLTIRNRTDSRTLFKKTFQSLADIIRTPIYGLVITIHHLGSLFLGLIKPNILYKTREIAGYLERSLLRVHYISEANFWSIANCFSPFANITTIHDEWGHALKREKQTVIFGMARFAQIQINFMRTKRHPCNNCFKLLGKNQTYISPAKFP